MTPTVSLSGDIDSKGSAVCVPNGHYDAVTGTVTFTAVHFSCYAVSYNQVAFKDVQAGSWYYKAVNFIAARGITTGTENGNFDPGSKLTRGRIPYHADESLRHRS